MYIFPVYNNGECIYLYLYIAIIISHICIMCTNICIHMDQLHQLILHDFYINSDRCYQVVYNIINRIRLALATLLLFMTNLNFGKVN